MQKALIICIEGNIASGKSTLLPKLAAMLQATTILEPVDSDTEFQRLLGLFSFNPADVNARNNFQYYITTQRANLLKNLNPNNCYIIERSLLSDLVFTHACMSNYENTIEDAAKHMDCYKHLIAKIHDYPTIDYCIYLKTKPEIAYQRMKKRARPEEMTLSLRYLQDISAFHDAVLPQACRKMGTELIEVNWNNPNAIELLKDKLSGLNLSNRSL
ncbi:deoxynucleoside kinase [Photobacterium kishitanii]|uniref:deoxynucleoside kinase n=1 Tax=Photobacterium kishitanii TaxID=318456 RepID=UPI00043352D4|nr:deoxynucleoside kinase [Photobacterium kishitanii]CEO41596.1 putative deoxyribonucleoside kinase [Photobacterium kishitanii]